MVVLLVVICSSDETVFLPTGVGGVIVVMYYTTSTFRLCVGFEKLFFGWFLNTKPKAQPLLALNLSKTSNRCLAERSLSDTPVLGWPTRGPPEPRLGSRAGVSTVSTTRHLIESNGSAVLRPLSISP